MNYIYYIGLILTFALVSFFIYLLKNSALKSPKGMTKNDFTLSHQKWTIIFAILVLALAILLLLVPVFSPVGTESSSVIIIIGLLMLFLGLWYIVGILRFKVTVKDDEITVRHTLSKTTTFNKNDIDRINCTNIGIQCYSGKKCLLNVSPTTKGYGLLLNYLDDKMNQSGK